MAEIYDVRSHEGVGPIRFGMTREQVRTLFTETPSQGRRAQQAQPYDFFEKLDFFCYYDADGLLKAVEFGDRPSVRLNGHELCGIALSEARRLNGFIENRDGFLSKEFGVSLWFDGKDQEREEEEGEAKAGSVLIFRPGYYG